jgi:hypothetical protein
MSCAIKICSTTRTDSMPIGVVALEAARFLEQHRYERTVMESKGRTEAEVSLKVFPDSQRRCPEHVWGDEGPLND